ncbi:MAG: flagellar export chaperone FlgN [Porcipelethomonas sp.]
MEKEIFEVFYGFMLEYTEFFEETADKEKEKLSALLSDDLKRIEACLNEHQSIVKRTEQYERDRLKIQKELGFENMTFREVIDSCRGEEKEQLQSLYQRFKIAIDSVKHSNKTSLQVAETNLKIMENITRGAVTDAKCYDTRGVASKSRNIGILNRKI